MLIEQQMIEMRVTHTLSVIIPVIIRWGFLCGFKIFIGFTIHTSNVSNMGSWLGEFLLSVKNIVAVFDIWFLANPVNNMPISLKIMQIKWVVGMTAI